MREDSNTKIRNENGNNTTDLTEIKKIISEYYELLYVKLGNLDEMGTFLEKHKLMNLTQEEIHNLSRCRTSKEIELIIF